MTNKEDILAIQKLLESNRDLDFIVKKKLINLHPLIEKAKHDLDNRDMTYYRSADSMIGLSVFDIVVTRRNTSRALCFMDSFIKLCIKLNYNIENTVKETHIYIDGQKFQISLREKSKRVKRQDTKWPSTDLQPTNKLYFKIYCFYVQDTLKEIEFIDGKQSLEDQLSHIIATLKFYAQVRNHEDQIASEKRRSEEEELRLKKEQIRQKLDANEVLAKLADNAKSWNDYKMLVEYISELERLGSYHYNSDMGLKIKEIVVYAKEKLKDENPIYKFLQSL